MKKGQRPSRHFRKVRTKIGRRLRFINPSIKKKKKRAAKTVIIRTPEGKLKKAIGYGKSWEFRPGAWHYSSLPTKKKKKKIKRAILLYPEIKEAEKYFQKGGGMRIKKKESKEAIDAKKLVETFEMAEALIAKTEKASQEDLLLQQHKDVLIEFKSNPKRLKDALCQIDMMKTAHTHPRTGHLFPDPFPTLKDSIEIKRFIEKLKIPEK